MFAEHFHGILLEMLYDALGSGSADAGNEPGTEKTLHAEKCGGNLKLKLGALELASVLGMFHHLSGENALFTWREFGKNADHRVFTPAGLDLDHRIPILRIPENRAGNRAFELVHPIPP